MTETWQTIEQAAITLGVSVRTINRHITAGKYPSRLLDGRREVLIDLPEPAVPIREEEPEPQPRRAEASNGTNGNGSHTSATATRAAAAPQAAATSASAPTYDSVSGQNEMMLAISDNWRDQNELVASAYQTLARNAEDFARSRQRSARVAWSIVGVLTVGVVAAVGWTSYSLSHTDAENGLLKQQLADARREADKKQAEAEKYQEHWTTANERTSRALEARVGGMIEPTAHPAGPATLAAAPTPAAPPVAPPPASATQPATQPGPASAAAPPPAPAPAPIPATGPGTGAGSPAPPAYVAPRPATQPGAFGTAAPAGRG